ncbi:MAG: KOW domain-containing RNA-binding protein [Tissierellia bacterium]|nr:KOW domain-containing RNA-binding protein [Tissierellia bacterium]
MPDKIKVGQIVRSRAGRDFNRHFVIIEVMDHEYVRIVDGSLRKVDAPKKKKVKHLAFLNANATKDPEFTFTNKKLKSLLKSYNDGGEDR